MQNIHSKFVKKHKMWKYHNAILRFMEEEFCVDVDIEKHSERPKSKNHVTINCSWKNIVEVCNWFDNKMVRFKFVEKIPDVQASVNRRNPVMIPVFHMC